MTRPARSSEATITIATKGTVSASNAATVRATENVSGRQLSCWPIRASAARSPSRPGRPCHRIGGNGTNWMRGSAKRTIASITAVRENRAAGCLRRALTPSVTAQPTSSSAVTSCRTSSGSGFGDPPPPSMSTTPENNTAATPERMGESFSRDNSPPKLDETRDKSGNRMTPTALPSQARGKHARHQSPQG